MEDKFWGFLLFNQKILKKVTASSYSFLFSTLGSAAQSSSSRSSRSSTIIIIINIVVIIIITFMIIIIIIIIDVKFSILFLIWMSSLLYQYYQFKS